MATKLFLLNTTNGDEPNASDVTDPEQEERLDTTAGSSATSAAANTSTNPTVMSFFTNGAGGSRVVWWFGPIAAVTISGTITINLWMSENNMSANAGAHVIISRHISDGTWQSDLLSSGKAVELPVTTRAAQNWTGTPTSTSFSDGDWLAVKVGADNAGGTQAAGFTFDLGWAGSTAGSDGDSFVQFTEALSRQTVSGSKPTITVNREAHRRSTRW